MSVEAITWALKQPVRQSSTKFVLVAMANCADGHSFECYPSIAYLCDATAQNRKTVIDNIKRLRDDGFIEDTGERKGRTGSIKAYRLRIKEVPKTVPLTSTETGTSNQYRKRNSTENGTAPKTVPLTSTENDTACTVKESEAVPFSDGSSTENGHEAVPKTGHGTVSEPSVNQKQESARDARRSPSGEKSKTKATLHTFDAFAAKRREEGRPLIDSDDPIFEWAENAGIPDDWLRLSWIEFATRYKGEAKRYADWPKTFRNAVRNNWFEFWRVGEQGQYLLTTKGEMARRAALTRKAAASDCRDEVPA